MPEDKEQLRTQMKARRASMSAGDVLRASESIREQVLGLDRLRESESVFVYVSANHEPDTYELIRDLLSLGKRVSVPRIHNNSHIQPHRITSLDELEPGGADQFSLPVPPPDSPIEPEPDITIVPGLAFTRTGQRLGMGGGYYDRYLAHHPGTFSIGLCYGWQLVDELPAEPHDRIVRMLVTESGVVSCG